MRRDESEGGGGEDELDKWKGRGGGRVNKRNMFELLQREWEDVGMWNGCVFRGR